MQIYLVGGAVRDQLLGYPVKDRDWVVVGATPEQMLARGFKPVGSDFPVFIHPDTGEEYALARTERKSGKGYTGFQYHASPEVTLEQDLSRRDLTINAIAQAEDGTLVDPYHGQADLHARRLCHVSGAFAEDPLRVLRVARFAARYAHLGFQVATPTLTLMAELAHSDELDYLTPERVWQESLRALQECSPLVYFQILQQVDADQRLFPFWQGLAQHPLAQPLARQFTANTTPEVRFASLCYLSAQKHADPGQALADFCQQIRCPKRFTELARQTLTGLPILLHWPEQSAAQRLAFFQQADVLRRPERLAAVLHSCQLLYGLLQDTPLESTILVQLHQRLLAVDPAALVAQGLSGAAIGQALQQQRLSLCQQCDQLG